MDRIRSRLRTLASRRSERPYGAISLSLSVMTSVILDATLIYMFMISSLDSRDGQLDRTTAIAIGFALVFCAVLCLTSILYGVSGVRASGRDGKTANVVFWSTTLFGLVGVCFVRPLLGAFGVRNPDFDYMMATLSLTFDLLLGPVIALFLYLIWFIAR